MTSAFWGNHFKYHEWYLIMVCMGKKGINNPQIAKRKSSTYVLNTLPISPVTHMNTHNVVHIYGNVVHQIHLWTYSYSLL
jgi:hypothetical protein